MADDLIVTNSPLPAEGPEPAPPTPPETEPPAEPDAPVIETPEPPAEATAPPEPDADGNFPKSYVEELRAENAKYRTRARDYEQVFDGYDDEDREAWLTLVDLAKTDPDQAREIMLQLAQAEAEEVTAGHPEYLTREDAEAMFGQQIAAFQQAQAEAQAVEDVVGEAKSLGYERDTEDYILLLHFANQMEEPDLAAADRQVKAYQQAQIDRYLADKESEADASPRVPTATGTPPSLTTPPMDWAAAKRAATERFDRLPG